MKGTAWLRQQNEKRTLVYLRSNPVCTRLEIGKALGVSKNTVSLIVDKFIEEGMVRETGIEEQGCVGRPRRQLTLVADVYKSIGIFIQKSSGQYVVTDYTSTILEQEEFPLPTDRPEQSLAEIACLSERLLERHPETLGIGLGIPGLVDPMTGIVHYSSHLGWRQIAAGEILSSNLSIPVKILNNVKASALAPRNLVLEEPVHSVFYIHIDKGVGGALIVGKGLLHGVSSTAGEIGHLVVQSDGPVCTCGQKGCLEALVSVPNILKELGQVSLMDAIHQAKENPRIRDQFEQRGTYLGMAISQIIHLFNPQYVIIDTPLQDIPSFQQGTIDAMNERTLQFPLEHTLLRFAHSHFGAARGAALGVILDFEQM